MSDKQGMESISPMRLLLQLCTGLPCLNGNRQHVDVVLPCTIRLQRQGSSHIQSCASPTHLLFPIPHCAVEEMQVSTSPYAVAARAAGMPAAAVGQELARAAHAFEALDETWVTVFGFCQADLPLVIREFSKAGDIQQASRCLGGVGYTRAGIVEQRLGPAGMHSQVQCSSFCVTKLVFCFGLQFGTFGEGAAVNWIHIEYRVGVHLFGVGSFQRAGPELMSLCLDIPVRLAAHPFACPAE